ncbi:MAG: 30S ribosomal protein S5 [Candidatus Harrisonbacteria bacterium CG10_big_fil_rev_8_21_14_0_10_45_28]|uniref:Small ribosomal subunit protein uS5 n=1 Tax=Candidatus Harrisonbacteria bacterium CG10_big_fil_rev_8_21_14_0_10_45_28 TaxID=1974586 RepID=A0A2H0UNV3_9BACT|nr:MAG: 30S ribosomal protein S5 [Candidatus Harrisonbacteria bacterium CG10_big_fil_rev_8_21_14_0_10_45_28]
MEDNKDKKFVTKTADGVKTTFQGGGFKDRRRSGGSGGGRKPFVREKQEFKEKVIDLRRVTRVMAGGKRFRFRTTIIIGDEKGRVGVGTGKGVDVVQSIGKAKNDAKKNLMKVAIVKGTIPHEVLAKFSAAKVLIKPARVGNGLVAGGAVRTVLALAGVKDVTAKCLGKTGNKLTNAWATIEALKLLKGKDTKIVEPAAKVAVASSEDEGNNE